VIFDPKILQKIKGKVTVLDSQAEVLAAALKYHGYSVNDRDPAHWQQAKETILKAKPYWAAFMAQGYIKELSTGNIWVVHGYSNDIFQADTGAQEAMPCPRKVPCWRWMRWSLRKRRRDLIWRTSSSTSCSRARTRPP
jgi:spermidine/putrescine-binding protein